MEFEAWTSKTNDLQILIFIATEPEARHFWRRTWGRMHEAVLGNPMLDANLELAVPGLAMWVKSYA